MSRPLPRYLTTTTTDQTKIDRIIANTNPTPITLTPGLANPADLRGIPCIARGVGGTQPNTNPLTETIRRNP